MYKELDIKERGRPVRGVLLQVLICFWVNPPGKKYELQLEGCKQQAITGAPMRDAKSIDNSDICYRIDG